MTGSVYRVPDEAKGEARIYGTFPNQRILGSACSITVERLEDGHIAAIDEMGIGGVFNRGGVAIHISGLDSFGDKAGPGIIKHIGLYCVAWDNPEGHKPCGFGCDGPEPGVILADESGYCEEHHAMMSGCDSFVTLEGIYRWCDQNGVGAFSPAELCADMDRRADRFWKFGKQQIASVRRLLEYGLVSGLPAHPVIGDGKVLDRIGRWKYCWRDLSKERGPRSAAGKDGL